MKQPDKYKEVIQFEYPGAVVRVHIPDITAEERSRRIKRIEKAAEDLLKAAERGKQCERKAG